jgi:hypothetical protein
MNEIQNRQIVDEEFDLINLLKKVYSGKKFIIKITILAALFGIVYALFQPNEFTASTTFIPQLSSDVKTGGSSISGLASLAGIDLGGVESSSELPPSLYPQVVESIPFKLELLASNIIVNNEELTLREYIKKNLPFNLFGTIQNYIIGLPSLIFNLNKNTEEKTNKSLIYSVSKEDSMFFKSLTKALSLSINDKVGFITMSYTDKNKSISAQVTQVAQSLLQEKIIEYKVQSSKELLDFTISQYNENKTAFEKLQDERAVFVDKNMNISSSLYQNKLSRIESELSILQTVVEQLASQVEQAKLQVNKDTPVFTTIKPVTIPYEKSAPTRSFIVMSFLFISFVLSSVYVVFEDSIKNIIKSLKS